MFVAATVRAQECRVIQLTPAQPELKLEEGERATESQTFQTTALALSPSNLVYFFDTASRIRRIEPAGRLTTVAGNGVRGDSLNRGPALEQSLPAVTQILFSRDGVLHFVSAGRVWRLNNSFLDPVAGSGLPGFNGESGPATEVNLGTIVNVAFDHQGDLLILDGYNRVRRAGSDGRLRTIVGSTRPAAAAGFTGDNGPADQASLSSARQIFPLKDGSFWIKDFSGRHLRVVSPDGVIRTINQNFEPTVNIVPAADASPLAATANRLYPIRPNGAIETGAAPFAPFTGTPLAVASDGSLFFLGSTRPEQRNPLVRMTGRTQVVLAGAPVVATVDGQGAPFGIWNPRRGSLLYATTQGGKAGILEVREGQAPRFYLGGGAVAGDVEGSEVNQIAIFGVVAFSIDGEGRTIVADVYRRRIFIAGADNKISLLKANGEPVVYAPTGALASLQRIVADNAGDIYWFSQGATPTGGVFTAEITVWTRADASLRRFTVQGLNALIKLDDGGAGVIAGNGANFRTAYRISPSGLGEPVYNLAMLPLQSVTQWSGRPFFTAATRLFRGAPGQIEFLDIPLSPTGAPFVPDFVLASPDGVLAHLTDGGFYRIANIDACKWIPQPLIAEGGVVNAASFEFAGSMAPRQLLTIFGRGFGPPEGRGMFLDGLLRAGGQAAPYPALVLGNFSGAIPNATLTGTTLPFVYSNDRQVTVQAVAGVPTSGEYRLYFTWQGLQLIYPTPIAVRTALPGLFSSGADAAALNQDGSRNSASEPAGIGTIVQLFGTGFGAVQGTVATGDFFSATAPPAVTNSVEAFIGGLPARVDFAGGAPSALSGIYQLNLETPAGLAAGRHDVVVSVAGVDNASQKVAIWVK